MPILLLIAFLGMLPLSSSFHMPAGSLAISRSTSHMTRQRNAAVAGTCLSHKLLLSNGNGNGGNRGSVSMPQCTYLTSTLFTSLKHAQKWQYATLGRWRWRRRWQRRRVIRMGPWSALGPVHFIAGYRPAEDEDGNRVCDQRTWRHHLAEDCRRVPSGKPTTRLTTSTQQMVQLICVAFVHILELWFVRFETCSGRTKYLCRKFFGLGTMVFMHACTDVYEICVWKSIHEIRDIFTVIPLYVCTSKKW